MKSHPAAMIGRLASLGAILLTCSAVPLRAESSVVRQFNAPDGWSYYSVSLRAGNVAEGHVAERVVILFDTSASQVGEHRSHGLQVVDQILSTMSPDQSVWLCAFDMTVVPMTDGFVSPEAARTSGLGRLSSRFPAGATDMRSGIDYVLTHVNPNDRAAILYVGDGMSTAHLIQVDEMEQLLTALVQRRIPFHSYAVGSNQDHVLLGLLALRTGGMALVDDWRRDTTSQEIGELIADGLTQPVLYPVAFHSDWTGGEILPQVSLPLRSDRDTVYLARGRDLAGSKLSLSLPSGRELTWQLPEAQHQQGTTFVGHLWQQAARDQGLSVWTAGEELLIAAQGGFEDTVVSLEDQALAALQAGQITQAEQLAFQIRQIDPANIRAAGLIDAAGDAIQTVAVADHAPLAIGTIVAQPTNEEASEVDPFEQARVTSPDLDPITTELNRRQARADRLRLELQNSIEAARSMLQTDPQRARTLIEESRAAIKAATDIDAAIQAELMRLAMSASQEIESQIEVIELRLQQQSIRIAEAAAQQRLLDHVRRQDQEVEMRVDRIRALMTEGYQGRPEAFEEAEAIALQIVNMRPGGAIGAAVLFDAEAAGQLDKAFRLRMLRYDQFLAVLHQVELAHVPFPDEPPIVYPSVGRWRWITQNRAHWKDVNLHQNNPNEERIYAALDQITRIEFQSMPLEQAMDYISQAHNIPIQLKYSALADEGVSPDDEITFTLSGITLRSALKIMLEDVGGAQLTYIIEDEIMKITTADDALNIFTVRIYPVGDFASPQELRMAAQSIGGGAGGGFGGGFGGFGGGQQGGGFGGGGFGGGGGGFGGGGFGGGGGGFFSIPNPEPLSVEPACKKKAVELP